MILRKVVAAVSIAFVAATTCEAQQRVTRAAAISSAVERGPRTGIARADSALAWAELLRARQYENPVLSLSYSKDTPQHHVSLEAPLDFLWLRNPRVSVARAVLDAASMRYELERQTIVYEADTTYTQAIAAAARARLSRSTARDADSLLVLARIRRDAGDGSELDVELAALNAGQAENVAELDSLEAALGVVAVQNIMGLDRATGPIAIVDTLDLPPPVPPPIAGRPLPVAAADADVRAADLAIALERRQRFGLPTITAGFDRHDPGGFGDQLLPTIGLALPIPVFNQNRGSVLVAQAARNRAQAQLALIQFETNIALTRARQSYTVAQERVVRSRQLVDRANRVAALSLLGFREGATTLSNVLEAQRLVRENLTQYVNDAAAVRNAASLIQFLERTAPTNANR